MSESFSSVLTFQQCPKKFEYSYVRNLQPKRRNINLTQGILTHEIFKLIFLMLRSEEITAEQVTPFLVDDMKDHIIEEFGANVSIDDAVLTLDDLWIESRDLVLRYWEAAGDLWKNYEILHVEEEFIAVIDGERIRFTPDLVVRDQPSGQIWIYDHKTCANFPTDGLMPTAQEMLYMLVVDTVYPDQVAGFVHSWLRKKRPTQPRLLKDKSAVAYLQTIDTTSQALTRFLLEEAPHLLDDAAHRRRIAELRDNRFFDETITYFNRDMVENYANDVMASVALMKEGPYPRHVGRQCRSCAFLPLCHGELLQWDTDRLLSSYEPRDPKNIYESEED